jgi:4a-hydroxytetrahydrobiopterin dehydratase
MTTPLAPEQIQSALARLPGWKHEDGALTKKFKMSSFREAMSFIVRVAFEAEALNHHPEVTNVYSTVRFALRTHDAGDQVTDRDVELATTIQRISWVG